MRRVHRLGPVIPVVFLEPELGDESDFYQRPHLRAVQEGGGFGLRIIRCVSIAHLIASAALELSRATRPPGIHFGWSEEDSLAATVKLYVFGEGNMPSLLRELVHNAEPDPER